MPGTPRSVIGLAILALVLGDAAAQQWRSYTNARFGAAADVPVGFRPEPPPANNDGRSFVSPDGTARISIYSSNAPSVVVASFAEYAAWLMQEEAARYPITYKAAGKGWFAFSGISEGEILYTRVIAGCPDQSIAHHVQLRYRVAAKAEYDPIVSHVAKSLRHASDAGC